MKYWAYLVGKLVLAAGLLYPFWTLIQRSFSRARPFDLAHYLTMFAFGLIAVGIAWVIVWDQRYRCRTCLRRLRMPIQRDPGITFCWARRTRNTFARTAMGR